MTAPTIYLTEPIIVYPPPMPEPGIPGGGGVTTTTVATVGPPLPATGVAGDITLFALPVVIVGILLVGITRRGGFKSFRE